MSKHQTKCRVLPAAAIRLVRSDKAGPKVINKKCGFIPGCAVSSGCNPLPSCFVPINVSATISTNSAGASVVVVTGMGIIPGARLLVPTSMGTVALVLVPSLSNPGSFQAVIPMGVTPTPGATVLLVNPCCDPRDMAQVAVVNISGGSQCSLALNPPNTEGKERRSDVNTVTVSVPTATLSPNPLPPGTTVTLVPANVQGTISTAGNQTVFTFTTNNMNNTSVVLNSGPGCSLTIPIAGSVVGCQPVGTTVSFTASGTVITATITPGPAIPSPSIQVGATLTVTQVVNGIPTNFVFTVSSVNSAGVATASITSSTFNPGNPQTTATIANPGCSLPPAPVAVNMGG